MRGRIEAFLHWAKVRKYRTGEKPARWRGHLEHTLPKRNDVQKVAYHAALLYDEAGVFTAALRTEDNIAARALEFLILTATRTSETIGAHWDEFDLDKALWAIPAERIKAGKEHRVPLSDAALAIVKAQAKLKENEFVFPGGQTR